MAMDEQVRIRKFLSFRVFWKLVKTMPVLMQRRRNPVVLRTWLGDRRLFCGR